MVLSYGSSNFYYVWARQRVIERWREKLHPRVYKIISWPPQAFCFRPEKSNINREHCVEDIFPREISDFTVAALARVS